MHSTENSQNHTGPGSAPAVHLVPFHGDQIVTFEADGKPHVAMRRIVENMRIDWSRQAQKLQDQSGKFTCRHMSTRDSLGREQTMLCMPVDKLPLWLVTINPNKIRDVAIRAKVEEYQAESAIALHDYWTKGTASRENAELRDLVLTLASEVRDLRLMHDPRRAALEYASVCELIDEAGAMPKGRNSLNRRVGYDLKQRSLKTVANDDPSPVRRAAHTGTWLYKREFADRYMRERGLALVADHNAKVTGGQGVIKFPDRRKTSNEAHPST